MKMTEKSRYGIAIVAVRGVRLSFYHCGSTHIPPPLLWVEAQNLATVVCYNRYCGLNGGELEFVLSLSGQTHRHPLVARRRVTLRLPHLTLKFFLLLCFILTNIYLSLLYSIAPVLHRRDHILPSIVNYTSPPPDGDRTEHLATYASRLSYISMAFTTITWDVTLLHSWMVIFTHPYKDE